MSNVIQLPINPENYYGSASTLGYIFTFSNPPTFYIGPSRDVVEMKGLSCRKNNDVYEFLVKDQFDKEYVLLGTALTRVNLKNESR